MAIVTFVGLTITGCGDSGPELKGPSDEGMLPESIAVRTAFESAPASSKYAVEDALKLVRTGSKDPKVAVEAVRQLQVLAVNPNYSSEQKQALEALIARVKSDAGIR
jgi:hypothetical protein